MGLFGFIGKAVGAVAKAGLSKVTGGASDLILKAIKSGAAKKPTMATTQNQALELKYGPAIPKSKKPSIARVAAVAKAMSAAPAARRSASVKRAARPKPPCKYGERINGRCPPKPKTARAPSTRMTKAERRASSRAASLGRKAAASATSAVFRKARTASGRAALGSAVRRAAPLAGVAAAGAAAYTLTRRSKVGGAAGDAVVSAIYRRKDKKADANLAAFRAQLAAERKAGKVSSARVRQIAQSHGLGG